MRLERLELDVAGPVARVWLNRPDVRNAFDGLMVTELRQVLFDLGAVEEVRVIVLGGRGPAFCAGADLDWMRARAAFSRDENLREAQALADMFFTIYQSSKPVVARVHGAAMGGGAGLVAAADIAVAALGTQFGFPEARLGLIPAVISPYVLGKIGESAARELFLTGEKFGAMRAFEIGLVRAAVPEDDLDTTVDRRVQELILSGPRAISEAKALIREVAYRRPEDIQRYTVERVADLRVSSEGQEGMRAFLEKRKPGWNPLTAHGASAGVRARLDSVDFLRGAVMVLMALDHTRDFFSEIRFAPEDMSQTYAGLFFTRWITHFCAPAFSLLAGTSIYFAAQRRTPGEMTAFLLKRGFWLIVLEWTIVKMGWTFLPMPAPIMAVIWALGASMIAMAALVRLPVAAVGAFAVVAIAGHNLLDAVTPDSFGRWRWLWMILHQPGFYPLPAIGGEGFGMFVLYPLIPWIAVMAAGYVLGALYSGPPETRRRTLMILGASMVLLFVALRATNVYGNPPVGVGMAFQNGTFEPQPTLAKTIIKFLNVEKYPPSFQYLLMTLGPALLFLGGVEGRTAFLKTRLASAGTVFGRVPLFYYVLHLYLIHAMAIVVGWTAGMPVGWLFRGGFVSSSMPPEYGFSLPVVYLAWVVAVAILYAPCWWFARLKQRRSDAWLSYV